MNTPKFAIFTYHGILTDYIAQSGQEVEIMGKHEPVLHQSSAEHQVMFIIRRGAWEGVAYSHELFHVEQEHKHASVVLERIRRKAREYNASLVFPATNLEFDHLLGIVLGTGDHE